MSYPVFIDPVQIPGSPGAAGINAFTVLTANLTLNASVNQIAYVSSNAWMAVGQPIFISDGVNKGSFQVVSIIGYGAYVKWLNTAGDSTVGTVLVNGAAVVPGGFGAAQNLPALMTDLSGGSNIGSAALGTGIIVVPIYINLVNVTAADILTNYTPGFSFKLVSVAFAPETAPTTAGRGATISPTINGVAPTPANAGVLVLTSANSATKGVVFPAGVGITGTNTGTASGTISLTGSALVGGGFAQGTGWIYLRIQNLDTVNAISSLIASLNQVISGLS